MTSKNIFKIDDSSKAKTKIIFLIEKYNNATDCFDEIKILHEILQINDFYYDFSLEDFKDIVFRMLKDIQSNLNKNIEEKFLKIKHKHLKRV